MNIDEKAIWEWIGFQEIGDQWLYYNKKGDLVYAEILPPNIRSLDVQAKYLWPKLGNLLVRSSTDPDDSKKREYRVSIGGYVKYHKDPATAVLLAVTSLIKEGDDA